MASNKSASDNPWAEMSRIKSDKTEAESSNAESLVVTTEELQEMSIKELQALAKEAGIDFKGLDKQELIDAIIEETGIAEEELLLEEDEESGELELEGEELDGEMSLEEALALLGEDSETEEDFGEGEFEEVEVEVQEGDATFEFNDNN